MTEMKHDLLDWTTLEADNLGFSNVVKIESLREQASLRQYFRIYTDKGTLIGVISDPESDENILFETHSKFLEKNQIQVPHVMASNHEKGFLILQDFGDLTLQELIGKRDDDFLYQAALKSLVDIQSCDMAENLLKISFEKMIIQMKLFEDWLLSDFLKLDYSEESHLIKKSIQHISEECSQQIQKVCHFDFEFRNLMLLSNKTIGILDFQDLCIGPYAIDVVSIIKDIDNPLTSDREHEYLEFFLRKSGEVNNLRNITIETLSKDVDYAGFQRQLRILGTLSRLHLRDKKSFRLPDLSQTLNYLIQGMNKYPELKEFSNFLEIRVRPQLAEILEDVK